jgi:hypothetical protein
VLTKRDIEILNILTKAVRVLTVPQIARTWWPESPNGIRVAENRLRALAAERLVYIERAPAHPELLLEMPVASWRPGAAEPDFGAVAYSLQSRWREHPVLTPCVSATEGAANRFGGHCNRPPRSVERTHDIHMARVYLLYRLRHPELLKDWIFEEQIKSERRLARREPAYGEKLPDVVLRTSSQTRVIEFGGAYGKDKLIAFHGYCKERSFPYELW